MTMIEGGAVMPLLTVREFYETRLYELDDVIYRRIERKFRLVMGDAGAVFLIRHMCITVAQLSANTCVDVMDCFKVL